MDSSPAAFMVRKLRTRIVLSDSAERAVLSLPFVEQSYIPSTYLVREGMTLNNVCQLIVSGFAFRHKINASGSRQIVSVHLTGDFIEINDLFLGRANNNVQALTKLKTINIERSALRTLIREEPSVGEAIWIDSLVEASISREWIVNVGRRSAGARIAHLLCEFAARMKAAGLSDGKTFNIPMTQEQIADATALTPVHVNRTLKILAVEGLIRRNGRHISLEDIHRIRCFAEFSDSYLYLKQTPVFAY